jgi:1-deoxyxylulose-5-phosphate synthase
MAMRHVALPGTDLNVSAIGYGVAEFGTRTRGADADHLLALYHESGGNLVDTAHCYAFWLEDGLGASERELGAAIRRLGIREDLVVATKGGHPGAGEAYPQPEAWLSPEAIGACLDESLERLGMPSVDLYYLHRDDGRTPVDEAMDALNVELAKGRVRALGASNWSVERIAAANEYARGRGLQGFCCSQIQGSLAIPVWEDGPDPVTRYITPETAAWHTASGIPIMAYSATSNGYFGVTDGGPETFRTAGNDVRRERTRALARELGCTPTQVAVAWLLAQEAPTVALFSTSRAEHLTEVMASLEVTLTREQARWLREG